MWLLFDTMIRDIEHPNNRCAGQKSYVCRSDWFTPSNFDLLKCHTLGRIPWNRTHATRINLPITIYISPRTEAIFLHWVIKTNL